MQLQEIRESFDQKVRRGMFDPVGRHLSNPDTAEDRLQEGLAQTWELYQRACWRGEEPGRVGASRNPAPSGSC